MRHAQFTGLTMLAGLALVVGCSGDPGTGGPEGTATNEPQGAAHLVPDLNAAQQPPMMGAFSTHEGALVKRDRRPHGSPNMTFHNGPVLASTASAIIFWGTSWSSSSFAGDKITGLDSWYSGFGGSGYAGTADEYSGTNGKVTSTVSYAGHQVDTSTASGGNSTSAILAEVCKEISNPATNGYYAVYTDLPRGNASYCAYHSWGNCGSTQVQFAFFWSLDGDAGCDPGDTSGLHSQGLAALANVSGHELSEARTDPDGTGWFDSSGSENGDKCAWSWPSGAPLLVTFSNGSQWKIQGEWSNAAYTAQTGFANLNGQRGCIF